MSARSSRVTSRDVARLARVSQSSVSRAFTAGSALSDEKRARILEAAKRLNYVPNSIASMLITRRSNTIALIVGNTDNPFYIGVLKEFLAELQAGGRQVLTFVVDPGSSSDDVIMRVLQHQVDGIILTAAQLSTQSTSLCRDRGIPIVLFNRYIPRIETVAVRCDNAGGAETLGRAFLAAGATSFAIIKGDPLGTTSHDRVQGFRDALWRAGIPATALMEIEGGSVYDTAFAAIRDTYGVGGEAIPDGIFAVNDVMAMGAIDALRFELGRRVPEDIMVAGFDGIPEASRAPYRLTTMVQPIQAMVQTTVGLLIDDAGEEGSDPPKIESDIILDCKILWGATLPDAAA
ncbi:substrate-binding domain-containing protein [Parasphingopyxis algicola]|uniref:LacI family DNA-binding transcriptional regulator n=1 Tax=Parasphingopyxis algicola TaxID=2026624 RepID=UPI0015A4E2DB|nr:LacI family DNA-binding transcriptional regulator [Parasphingopyxis algicola]QLC26387.1 substrate-binding domain-containing protein [Parasphingopyxis algicola]